MSVNRSTELHEILNTVQRRWRMRHALRGGVMVGIAAIVAFVITSFLVQQAGFGAGPVIAAKIVSYAAIVLLFARYVVYPLLRRVSNEQVALYLEEYDPSVREIVVSALAVERDPRAAGALGSRIVERAVARCRDLDNGRDIEREPLRREGISFGAVAATVLVLVLLNTPWLAGGRAALLQPLRSAGGDRAMIAVEPGNVTVPRGADAEIRATLQNFAAGEAEVVLRTAGSPDYIRIPMLASGDTAAFEAALFDVAEKTEYFIEAGGIRSPVFTIDVADIPYVQSLDLDYTFPSYTSLPPQRVEDGGDIAAPAGTRVAITAHTTLPAAGGRIAFASGRSIPLTLASDGTLSAVIPVTMPGIYHIELTTTQGTTVRGSAEYTIDVLEDRSPSVVFSKPGRDTRQTSVDEVFLEAKADDDYGIARLELVYAVNGGEEKAVPLYGASPLAEVTAGHTLYLEEFGLRPGDVVSYYARATDNGLNPRSSTSDIYFLTIRPYSQNYRQADAGQQQPPGGGGGGGGGDDPGELSQQQRDIIAATYNVLRDSTRYDPKNYAESVNTITLMQERLREQVDQLATQMRERGITQDTNFARIAEILPRASAEMAVVLDSLRQTRARPSLGPEQRALQQLLHAESVYRDIMVQLQQQGGGGGGGGGQPRAQDLADLFDLEKDELQNQYETVQRGAQEQQAQEEREADETAERLKELARRMQQEAERMQRQLGAQGQSGGAGNASARRMDSRARTRSCALSTCAPGSWPGVNALLASCTRSRTASRSSRTCSSNWRTKSGFTCCLLNCRDQVIFSLICSSRIALAASSSLREACGSVRRVALASRSSSRSSAPASDAARCFRSSICRASCAFAFPDCASCCDWRAISDCSRSSWRARSAACFA
jgi:hypothetical protein